MRLTPGILYLFSLVFMGGIVAGCVPQPQSAGESLYRLNCAACHGTTGAGDGRLAADLPAPPANLRTLSAENGGVFPAERVMATIYGYRGKDYAGLMPEFGPLLDGPTVEWQTSDGRSIETPKALVDLANHLETLQDPQ